MEKYLKKDADNESENKLPENAILWAILFR